MTALERALAVADLLGQRDDLVSDGEPLLRRVGCPDRRIPAVERVRERRGIAEAPSHLDRLRTQRRPPLASRLVPQRAGEPGHQPGPQRARLLAQASERVFEERHDVAVAAGPRPHEPAAVAERGAGKQLGFADASGDAGCSEERFAPRLRVAGAHPRVAQRQQQLQARRLLADVFQREGSECHPVEADRLLVRQLDQRMITRLAGVCDRTVNFATATSLEEMMRQLRQMRIGIGAVERLQRLTGAGVKSSSMRRWKLVVERVPDEGVRESKAAVGFPVPRPPPAPQWPRPSPPRAPRGTTR